MTPIERLVARVLQAVKASPGHVLTITVVVDADGDPVCWQVTNAKAEGLQESPKM